MDRNLYSKQQIQHVVDNLSFYLHQLDLGELLVEKTDHPLHELQSVHAQIIQFLKSNTQMQFLLLKKQIKKNEFSILNCLKKFINLNDELNNFSTVIHQDQYSLTIYKSFRKLMECINQTSNFLYRFESSNSEFNTEKQLLITQNLEIWSSIMQQNSKSPPLETNTPELMSLRKQIEELNEVIRQNDEEFSLEIQRYNHTLYDLQETIRQYEVKLDQVRQYEMVISDLEHKIIRLKEEKCRDELLIEQIQDNARNMSKKIRFYEKDRGIDIMRSRNIGSPNIRSPNTSSINNFDSKSRNFLHQRNH